MILRSVTRHVRDQNWFAVGIDFLIVVVGVFIGIQVANWNEARVQQERERVLLGELRDEALRNAEAARSVGEGLRVGAAAARRVLSGLEGSGLICPEGCWPVIADLMHASQWQQISNRWTTYEELRRAGLPSDRRIIEAVEALLQTNHRAAQALETPPEYRARIRGRIPIELQDAYWVHCFREDDRFEYYVDPCPRPPELVAVPQSVIEAILRDPEWIPMLHTWTSLARVTGNGLVRIQPEQAIRIAEAIDQSIDQSALRR
jgi:hypothetical protein